MSQQLMQFMTKTVWLALMDEPEHLDNMTSFLLQICTITFAYL